MQYYHCAKCWSILSTHTNVCEVCAGGPKCQCKHPVILGIHLNTWRLCLELKEKKSTGFIWGLYCTYSFQAIFKYQSYASINARKVTCIQKQVTHVLKEIFCAPHSDYANHLCVVHTFEDWDMFLVGFRQLSLNANTYLYTKNNWGIENIAWRQRQHFFFTVKYNAM